MFTFEQMAYAAGAVVIAGGFAWMSGTNDQADLSKAVQTYALNEPQAAFTKICASNLKKRRLEFKGGAELMPGCGCIAKELGKSDQVKTVEDYHIRADLMVIVAKQAKSAKRRNGKINDVSEIFADVEEVAQKHSVPSLSAMSYLSDVVEPLGKCGVNAMPYDFEIKAPKLENRNKPKLIAKAAPKCQELDAAQKKLFREHARKQGMVFDEKCGVLTRK